MKQDAPDQIRNEWFPVALASAVPPEGWQPFELLDDRYVIVHGTDGEVTVVGDTCPHRGARLSLGGFDGCEIECGYHGWRFDLGGRCVSQPAHPNRTPPGSVRLRTVAVSEAYGFWWVCVGEEPRELPRSPAHSAGVGRTIWLDPVVVNSSGPRVIENFLDQAHFPFVHAGYLGQVPRTEVSRPRVGVVDGELRLEHCVFWQPRPGPSRDGGADVEYDYVVSHPYAASLTKRPRTGVDGDDGFSILLVASPLTETSCVVWRSTVVADPDADLDAQREFNDLIFSQDLPIVESQRPRRLPIDPRMEAHQPADSGSLAYRKWLVERGIRYGTVASEEQ